MNDKEREKLRKKLHDKINMKSSIRKSKIQKEKILENQGVSKEKLDQTMEAFNKMPKDQKDMVMKMVEQMKSL